MEAIRLVILFVRMTVKAEMKRAGLLDKSLGGRHEFINIGRRGLQKDGKWKIMPCVRT